MELRLFPLRTVVFPGQTVPLHIFEPRYRQLVEEVVDSGDPFGIVLIRQGREVGGGAVPVEVGCSVRIRHVEQFPDGRFNVTCEGERRFRIVQTLGERPYLMADVEFLPAAEDAATAAAADAADRLRDAYAEILRLTLATQNGWQRRFRLPQSPEHLVNYIAAQVEAPPRAKQEVLGASSVVAQMDLLQKIVAAELEPLGVRVAAHRQRQLQGLGVLN